MYEKLCHILSTGVTPGNSASYSLLQDNEADDELAYFLPSRGKKKKDESGSSIREILEVLKEVKCVVCL